MRGRAGSQAASSSGQGCVKVAEEAALPPDLRKASGFPGQITSLVPFGSAGRPSLPAEPKGLVRAEAVGKAKPFRRSGGRAALGCYVSGTLTRLCQAGWTLFSTRSLCSATSDYVIAFSSQWYALFEPEFRRQAVIRMTHYAATPKRFRLGIFSAPSQLLPGKRLKVATHPVGGR